MGKVGDLYDIRIKKLFSRFTKYIAIHGDYIKQNK